jgi:hypothetical protein
MDDLIRITKKITFGDLRQGRKTSIDVYEEQIKSWLIKPLKDLAKDKKNNFENGYAMFALELLFFEPHGKYLEGNSISASGANFKVGFNSFLNFLYANDFIDKNSLSKIRSLNFYNISRCGIYHTMTIKSGLLIDSIHMNEIKVFYYSPINNGILVSPWNFLIALEKYFENYIENLKINSSSEELRKFNITFNSLFQY